MYDIRFALWFSQTCVQDKLETLVRFFLLWVMSSPAARIQCRLFMIPQTMDMFTFVNVIRATTTYHSYTHMS